MNIQTNTTSRVYFFYAGLGTAAGIATVLAIQGIWRIYGGALLAPMDTAVGYYLGQQAQLMGLPLATGTKAYWYSARAGGIVAYLLLWLGTLWGVLMSGKLAKGQWAFGLHEFLSILAMVFAALHAIVLLGDAYIGFSVVNLLVPFTGPYRPLWTGFGTLALYLGVALIASFYLKPLVSRKLWRALHYLTYAVFTLALLHGVMAGTDSSLLAVRWMYVLTGASLLYATLYRIFTLQRRKPAAPAQSAPGGAVTASENLPEAPFARHAAARAQEPGREAML
jgi:hypothetical protein